MPSETVPVAIPIFPAGQAVAYSELAGQKYPSAHKLAVIPVIVSASVHVYPALQISQPSNSVA